MIDPSPFLQRRIYDVFWESFDVTKLPLSDLFPIHVLSSHSHVQSVTFCVDHSTVHVLFFVILVGPVRIIFGVV